MTGDEARKFVTIQGCIQRQVSCGECYTVIKLDGDQATRLSQLLQLIEDGWQPYESHSSDGRVYDLQCPKCHEEINGGE